jgi:outer membrane protein assembly factor BamB
VPLTKPVLSSLLETITVPLPVPDTPDPNTDGIKIASFLGDERRRFYGVGPVPERLEIIWKARIGGGTTGGTATSPGLVTWYGTGWTGQPALVREGGRAYLLIGGFDHNLRKVDAETGETLWKYKFDDVIKGSPTVFEDPSTGKLAVMVGSRRGFPRGMGDPDIAPFRCIDYETGKELWRLPVPRTKSYSRDADGSAFILDGVAYLPVESGYFYALDPFSTSAWRGFQKPKILHETLLLGDSRASNHGGNLVLESSPVLLDDTIYIASGSGHVYGMRRSDLKVVWDYWIGSDMDGTIASTDDGHLLVPVERQYISGKGGVFKLDPRKKPAEAAVWYFPTENRAFATWEGGVVGSVSVNDTYRARRPALAAFHAIDGNLYVVSQDTMDGTAPGPRGDGPYPKPKLVFKKNIGGGISTPIFVDDYIISAGYGNTVYVFRVSATKGAAGDGVVIADREGAEWNVAVTQVASFAGGGSYESTPIVWQGRIYLGSRDGSFYCIGDPELFGTVAPTEP